MNNKTNLKMISSNYAPLSTNLFPPVLGAGEDKERRVELVVTDGPI
jgi:hypothetical protein